MEILLATHNQHKIREMKLLFARQLPTLKLINDLGAPDPEETGLTMQENAIIKAKAALEFSGKWSLADDSGFEVDILNGQPGLYSKRFEGEHTSYEHKMNKILELLQDVPQDKRTAKFRSVMALAIPNEPIKIFEGILEGRVHDRLQGTNGFGYDPIMLIPELNCTTAEISDNVKIQISHHGKALSQIIKYLKTRI